MVSADPAPAPAVSGERLVYVVGCVNCHHQTPKEVLNAPPLVVSRAYSLTVERAAIEDAKIATFPVPAFLVK